jgi:hypothetical protein
MDLPHEPRLEALTAQLMAANEAPPEAFARLDLQPPSCYAGARAEAETARSSRAKCGPSSAICVSSPQAPQAMEAPQAMVS